MPWPKAPDGPGDPVIRKATAEERRRARDEDEGTALLVSAAGQATARLPTSSTALRDGSLGMVIVGQQRPVSSEGESSGQSRATIPRMSMESSGTGYVESGVSREEAVRHE